MSRSTFQIAAFFHALAVLVGGIVLLLLEVRWWSALGLDVTKGVDLQWLTHTSWGQTILFLPSALFLILEVAVIMHMRRTCRGKGDESKRCQFAWLLGVLPYITSFLSLVAFAAPIIFGKDGGLVLVRLWLNQLCHLPRLLHRLLHPKNRHLKKRATGRQALTYGHLQSQQHRRTTLCEAHSSYPARPSSSRFSKCPPAAHSGRGSAHTPAHNSAHSSSSSLMRVLACLQGCAKGCASCAACTRLKYLTSSRLSMLHLVLFLGTRLLLLHFTAHVVITHASMRLTKVTSVLLLASSAGTIVDNLGLRSFRRALKVFIF